MVTSREATERTRSSQTRSEMRCPMVCVNLYYLCIVQSVVWSFEVRALSKRVEKLFKCRPICRYCSVLMLKLMHCNTILSLSASLPVTFSAFLVTFTRMLTSIRLMWKYSLSAVCFTIFYIHYKTIVSRGLPADSLVWNMTPSLHRFVVWCLNICLPHFKHGYACKFCYISVSLFQRLARRLVETRDTDFIFRKVTLNKRTHRRVVVENSIEIINYELSRWICCKFWPG